jgi:dsDNA-specific endonuclease/ATPase MutS2
MSSSGQTAFVEPLETINLNNELVRLREIEQTEIIKVLFAITEELREERDALRQMADAIAQIDFIAAKARLAINHDAIEPEINETGRVHSQYIPAPPNHRACPTDEIEKIIDWRHHIFLIFDRIGKV